MKNLFLHSVLMASLAGVGAVATAQAQTTTQQPDQAQQAAPQGGQYHHRHAPNPQRETKMLTKKLGLSADQAAQVEPILADRAQRMEALSSTQGDPASMKTQRRTIMQDTKQKLDAVLTPAQQQEMAQMHHGHGRHGDSQQQTAPSTSPSL